MRVHSKHLNRAYYALLTVQEKQNGDISNSYVQTSSEITKNQALGELKVVLGEVVPVKCNFSGTKFSFF
jgi:hypothetical protein